MFALLQSIFERKYELQLRVQIAVPSAAALATPITSSKGPVLRAEPRSLLALPLFTLRRLPASVPAVPT